MSPAEAPREHASRRLTSGLRRPAAGPASSSSSFVSGFAGRAAAGLLAAFLALLLGAGAAHAQAPVTLSDVGGGCTEAACPDAPTGSADGGPTDGKITVK